MASITYLPRFRLIPTLLALCCGLTCAATGSAEVTDSTVTDPSVQDLDASFTEAAKLFKDGDATGALAIFRRLGEVTDSPNVQLYIGYCESELGRYRQAHQAFSLTVKRSMDLDETKYRAAREAAQEQLATLNQRMAKLTISFVEAPSEYEVTVDGEKVDIVLLGSPMTVEPGIHQVEAKSNGAKPLRREVTLDKGDSKAIALLFEKQVTTKPAPVARPVQTPQPSNRASGPQYTTFGLAAGGLGAVGLGVFAIAGLKTRSTYDRLRTECDNRCSDAAHRDAISQGKTLQTVANVGLAVGIAGTLSGAMLLYLGVSSETGSKPSVELAPGHASITYQRSF
jgi:hypothetical protein